MKHLKSKKGFALLGVLAIVAISAIGAYAYFTSTGTGSGTASTGSATNWLVAQDAYSVSYPAVTLYPGQNTQPLQGTVKNDGAANQQLFTITASIQAPSLALGTQVRTRAPTLTTRCRMCPVGSLPPMASRLSRRSIRTSSLERPSTSAV